MSLASLFAVSLFINTLSTIYFTPNQAKFGYTIKFAMSFFSTFSTYLAYVQLSKTIAFQGVIIFLFKDFYKFILLIQCIAKFSVVQFTL